ncbi:MAG: type II secretion system F family protein [Candidatus Daviesbacteria bacterium]
MPVFSYTAKDINGEDHKGEVETSDEFQVAQLLRRKKLIVINIKSHDEKPNKFLEKILSHVPFSEIVIMTRQLATMIGAGLVLSEAIDILEDQQSNKTFKKVLGAISVDVKGGMDFAAALEKYPDIFPPLYSKLIKAGQASGKLDTILLQLADSLEKEREFKNKVRGAMIYPIVIGLMMVAVMMIMVFFVMPKLIGLYQDSGIELPLPTKIMLEVVGIFTKLWWLVAFLLVIAVILFRRYIATSDGRLTVDQLILRTPVVGKVSNLVILTNFTRTFGLLILSGLSILDSIKIVGEITGNRVYKDSFEIIYKGVERGLSFSSQLLGLRVFPKIVGQMARTGEETGKLDEVMTKISDYFEMEADNSLKNITTLIEPIVLVILGIGVGFLAISVILPIYQLTTSIK